MPAYVIIDVDVTDRARYESYLKLGDLAAEKHGGTFIARGGTIEVLEGEWSPKRIAMLEFKDRAAAVRWYNSPEYQQAIAARFGATRFFRCIVTEGVEKRG